MERNNTSDGDNRSAADSWLPWQGLEDFSIQETIAKIQEPQLTNVIFSCYYCGRNPFNGCCENSVLPGIQARNSLTETVPLGFKNFFYELAIHDYPFRDYVLQEYIKALSQRQLSEIVQFMKAQLIGLCLHYCGYQFVLQLLNRATKSYLQLSIVEGLLDDIVILMQNSRGVKIVSQCLRTFSNDVSKLLCAEIGTQLRIIATNQFGYMQITKLVRDPKNRYRYNILMQISENALVLAEDQYGYGSHVVEKCLDIEDAEQVKEIVIELIRSPDISTLLSDSYGNFVIQHAWDVSKYWKDIHEELAILIQKHASELGHNLFGRNVLNKLKECWRRGCAHAL